MDKFEIRQCSRCHELYSSDDSSPKPIQKSKLFKSKRTKLKNYDILSPKVEENQALEVEIVTIRNLFRHS